MATKAELEREFKAWLRDTAGRKGLTQDDVARAVQAQTPIHPRSVTSWFLGSALPTYAPLVALCAALGELPPALRVLSPAAQDDGR